MIVAIAQMNTHAGDFGTTVDRMKALAQSAADQEAGLIVFPAPALSGQAALDYPNRDGFQMDLLEALDRLSQELACTALIPIIAEQDGESYREVILLKGGEATPLKMGAYAAEGQYARDVKGGQRNSVSSDISFPVSSFEHEGLKYAVVQNYDELDDLLEVRESFDVVIYVPSYGYALDDAGSVLGAALGENRFKADVTALNAWFVAAGSVGGYGLQVFTGSSFVMSPQGKLVSSAPAFEEYLLLAHVQSVSRDDEKGEERVTDLEPELYNKPLHLWQALTLGLRDYFQKQSRAKAVLLVDGSIGSCLLAALASDALGPKNVHVLIDETANEQMVQIARQVAASLHVEIVESKPALLELPFEGALRADVVRAVLADVARCMDAVLLASEDKTYLALESAPVAFRVAELLPFGDVYRSDLIELGHMRNTISPIIPAEAFNAYEVPSLEGLEEAEPTPEMRLKRIDVTLAMHVEWERSLSAVAARQGEPALCEEIVRRYESCAAVRRLWPVSLVASTYPLSDAHIPLCFFWHDRIRNEEDRTRAVKLARRFLHPAQTPEGLAVAPPDLSELLKGIEVELQGSSIPQNVDRSTFEGALGELFGLLQDISGGERPSLEGPFGPLTWGSPFSEN